jgi:uncharacterized membrane protein YbhN (UPF0104 family)
VQWPPRDPGSDLLASLQGLPLPVVVAVVVLPASAVLHFLFAGVAMWSASAVRLPLRTATRAQLAAAAANRVVPNGVAGAAVNIRCLQRSGSGTAAAVTTIAALGVVGGLTDAAYTALVAGIGPAVGVPGGSRALTALSAHGIQAGRSMPWVLVAAAILGLAAFAVVRRRALHPRVVAAGVRRAVMHAVSLLRRPQHLAVMAIASMGTTAALSVGFASTVLAVGHGHSLPGFATLIVVYLVGAAVGGATPLPAFVGVTEAALVAGLVLFGVPAVIALVATLVFRGVAFWAPVPIGLLTAKRLRAAHLL